ncbi:YafY family protein [uncultured Actinomyces sp.]|uniref:helix-turn-helix transcriptional regulator n=1 Tax=uncultured Actinomyces sp. TaxID=249061 RepID=UPI0015BB31F9|nr:WYL domain-containing protein [uncultured Actinomyces sp.]
MPEEAPVQVARILAMASWIMDNPGQNVRQIAQHFGRSSRQVRRDLEYMGQIGDSMIDRSYGLDWDLYETEGVVVLRGSQTPSLPKLTPAEAAALLVALRALAPYLSESEDEVLLSAGAKLASRAGHEGGDTRGGREVIQLEQESSNPSELQEEINAQHVINLRYAIDEKREVSFDYRGVNDTNTRRVYPRGLKHLSTGWILDAWDPIRETHRSYRVDRMNNLAIGEKHARVSIPSEPDPSTLTLTVSSHARWICEDFECTLISEDAQAITCSLPIWNEKWILALLCDISADIIECPSEWMQRVSDYAQSAMEIWEEAKMMRSEA